MKTIPCVVLSSTPDHESESTASFIDEDKHKPSSSSHTNNSHADLDTNMTTKNPKRQLHHNDYLHSDFNMKHAHVENNEIMNNDSLSSATAVATITQDDVNNNKCSITGTTMSSNTYGNEWLKRYKELRAFKQQCGHCNVPKACKKKQITWKLSE